ncbi:MAG TPA: hypothetical protein VFE63_16915 [Roseiarcus sp.]|jgi:hypothetical protein|nr:hypothetical protein [Roseiarcus sp.]
MIKLREVDNSCAHPAVAAAAHASLGGGVAAKVQAAAARTGAPPGVFVAGLVREFREHARPCAVAAAEEAMRRSETPVLAGLERILADALPRRGRE